MPAAIIAATRGSAPSRTGDLLNRITRLAGGDHLPGPGGQARHVVHELVDPYRQLVGKRLVADGREIDHDVRGRSPSRGLAEQSGHQHVARGVDVAPAGQRSRAVVAAAEALAGRSNVNAASDVLVAALLGEAAAAGAAANVRINLPSVGDDDLVVELTQRVDELVHDVARLAARAREVVASGEARDPLQE